MTVDTAISIAVSEVIAGAVGGFASRSAANRLGDKKRDTLETFFYNSSFLWYKQRG